MDRTAPGKRSSRMFRSGRMSWFVLLALAFGWFAQLPIVHQIHLAFDDVEHIWCPRHQCLEHLDARRGGSEPAVIERQTSGANIGRATAGSKHQACSLSLMHQVMGPVLQAYGTHARLPEKQVDGSPAGHLLCPDVLCYAPKHSPPSAA
ncbi:MAG TPA: hypothetical protein VM425_18690 [Myxococcota bacterium]|nr:hypothetical protein [Myxococcota bacterium]